MKKIKLATLFFLCVFISCSENDDDIEVFKENYEFILDYKATITVGGVVGIIDKTFKKGEKFKGKDNQDNSITLRIAEHSKRNDNCPNHNCYQELLDVPENYLKLVE